MMRKRRHKKKDDSDEEETAKGIAEPERESLYEFICKNLTMARKGNYIMRVIYFGEHKYYRSSAGTLLEIFRGIINRLNLDDHNEPLSGILLRYASYFVHIVEGSGSSVLRHFYLLRMEEDYATKFSNVKMLCLINHINNRFTNDWFEVPAKPSTLLEKIDPNSDREKTGKYIVSCIEKIYLLCEEIGEHNKREIAQHKVSEVAIPKYQDSAISTGTFDIALKAYYPEINLLQFLVQTVYLKKIEDYIEYYHNPEICDGYQNEVWPVPSTMVPYKIFQKPYDPCMDLPEAKVPETKTAQTREELLAQL